MTDWDLLTPGIGLTSIGIVGVGISLSGIAKTFIDGMHAVSLLTMLIGMIFLASGLFKDGFPSTGRAKSATFLTLGFLVTFGVATAVTVSVQVPSIFAYIGLMLIISVPAAVLTFASYKQVPYLKAIAIIFIAGSIVGGTTFYAFGLVAPKPPAPEEEEKAPPKEPERPSVVIPAKILAGASAQGNLNTAELDPRNFDYFCSLHPYMTGVLKVTESAGSVSPGAGTNATGNQTGSSGGNATQNQQNQTSSNTGATVSSVSIVQGAGPLAAW
jgi:hypothetical protein